MIYLLGASHIMALLDAAAAQEGQPHDFGDGRPPAFRPWTLKPGLLPQPLQVASIHASHHGPYWGAQLAQVLPDGHLGVAPGLQDLLAGVAADPQTLALCLSLRGHEYYQLCVAAITQPFDFVLPQRPDLGTDPTLPLLPLEVVSQRLLASLQPTLATLAAVRKLCPALRVLHLTPPPPAPSEAVAAWAADERDLDRPVQSVPTAVRLKLWTLYATLLEQGARALGVQPLAPPPEALDAQGALKPELMADAIHGNAVYGGLVWRQVTRSLEPAWQGAA